MLCENCGYTPLNSVDQERKIHRYFLPKDLWKNEGGAEKIICPKCGEEIPHKILEDGTISFDYK